MANGVLLASSLLCGAAHLAAFLACLDAGGEMLAWALAVLMGVATSVWNHATTSEIAKWADRLIVSCCALLDALFLWGAARPASGPVHTMLLRRRPVLHQDDPSPSALQDDPWAAAAGPTSGAVAACALALLAAVGLFLAAKAFEHRCHRKRDACHATSHVLATVLHVSMATLVLAPSSSAASA